MPDDYFDQFQLPQQDEPPKPEAKPEGEDKLAALQAELAALRAAQETERRTNQELMARMFAGTAGGQPQVQPTQHEVAINLDGLPDPRDDIEGYHRGLGERLGKTMQDMRAAVRYELTAEQAAANEQNGLFDRAWSRFGERHEELAGYPELVETATAQVFNEYRQQGIDPLRLMNFNLDDVVDKVGAKVQGFVDRIRGSQQQEDPSKPSGRTQMLDGATPKPRGRQAPEARPTDFLDGLKKLQAEMRIY